MSNKTQDELSLHITHLLDFKKYLKRWHNKQYNPTEKEELRSYINQNLIPIKNIVKNTGCQKLMAVREPIVLGGRIIPNIDPFDMIFTPYYNKSFIPDVCDIIDQTISVLKNQPLKLDKNNLNKEDLNLKKYYVDLSRIEELKSIKSSHFDLTKLITLCEELNIANQNKCYLSIAMLTRSVINHVPPIFSSKTFKEIVNNYKGSKSFKESMEHLENSMRKISDSHLHTTIRKKETLPNFVQVDFSSDLDVLLSEIVRIL